MPSRTRTDLIQLQRRAREIARGVKMYRRLRVVIPVIQVLAAIVVLSLAKFYGSSRFYEYYLGDAQRSVIGLNFPLVVFWVLVFSPIKWFTSYLPPLTGGLTAGRAALVVLLASSVALFWTSLSLKSQ